MKILKIDFGIISIFIVIYLLKFLLNIIIQQAMKMMSPEFYFRMVKMNTKDFMHGIKVTKNW